MGGGFGNGASATGGGVTMEAAAAGMGSVAGGAAGAMLGSAAMAALLDGWAGRVGAKLQALMSARLPMRQTFRMDI